MAGNIELLAAYNSGATGAGTHTVTLSKGPTLNTLYCIANSHGLMTIDGGTGGWVEITSNVNNIDYKIWRLDSPSSSKTSISFSHYNGNSVELSAVVFQAHVDSGGTPYYSTRQNDLTNRNGLTSIGTGLHTYSGETVSLAVFNVCGNSGVLSTSMDLTAYDLGFTELADTGMAQSSYGDSRIWVAINESTGSLSNNGVTATVGGTTWNSGVDSFGGMISLKLLAAPSGGPTPADNLGITDNVAVVKSMARTVSDSLPITDSMTASASGVVSKSQSEAVGITDNVSATLTPGGGGGASGGTNLEVLAQYTNGGTGVTTHTINLSHGPQLNTLYLVAMCSGMMTVDGGTGGWTQVASTVNSTDQKIWKLDSPSSSKTSVTVTTSVGTALAAVVFQAHVDSGITPYVSPYFNALNGRIGQSSIGTGLHTYSGKTATIAYFSQNGNSGALNGSQDLTSFDLGFTTFGKSGMARSSTGDCNIWLAVNTSTGSLSNSGVSATTAVPWDTGSDGYGGILSIGLLPVSGGPAPADNLGITDSVAVVKAVDRPIADSVGLTDSLSVDSNGVKNVTISDSLGITDAANRSLIPAGGSTQNSFRILAQYNESTPTLTRTITLSQAASLGSLFVIANSASLMSVSSDNTNWVQVGSYVNGNDLKIWRLDSGFYGAGKTSVTITTNVSVNVAAVVFEAEVDTSQAPYYGPFTGAPGNTSGWSTGSHTFTGMTDALAVYCAASPFDFPGVDINSYDQSFTEVADSGYAPKGTTNGARVWLARKTVSTFSSQAVVATVNQPDVSSVIAAADSRAGVFAFKLLPTATPLSSSPADPVGITDSVLAQKNLNPFNQSVPDSVGITDSLTVAITRAVTIADSVGITDAAQRGGLSPTIAQENANPTGVQDRTWWSQGVENSFDLPAFARSSYYLPGQTAQFSVNYNSAFSFEVWRMGYYGGGNNNARKVYTGTGTPTAQPAAQTIPNSNGANDCSNWSVNASWAVPTDATPGWYYVLLYNAARTQFSWLLFCVSDALEKKDMVIVSSDSTWMGAYNYYGTNSPYQGGPSLYGNGGAMTGGSDARAYAVSLNRPVVTRFGIPQTHYFNSEYPFNRFIERMGFNVGYVTNEQVENDPTVLDGRKVIIFNGHNEYTSQTLNDKIRQLTSTTNVNILNFAGNDFFWRIRYGTLDGSDTTTKGRVIWCRKDTMSGPTGTGHVGGTPIVAGDWGGTWQDTRWQSGANGFQDVMGDYFKRNGVANESIQIPFAYKSLPIWRNCPAVQSLTSGQVVDLGAGTAGMEWDAPLAAGQGPPRVALSEATYTITSGIADINGQDYSGSGSLTHQMQMMRTVGGGYILNASTTQWAWGLDDNHDRGTAIANVTARQATLNLIYDFGIQTDDASLITALGLTVPTPLSNVGTAYAIPGSPGGGSFTKADNVGILDTVTADMIRNYQITITDSVGAADAPASPRDMPQALADALGITDAPTYTKDLNFSIADALGLTDNLTSSGISTKSVNLSDTLGITDTYLLNWDWSRSLGDGVSIGDSATGAIAVPLSKAISDLLGITDALARTAGMARPIADSVGLTDYVYAYKYVPGATKSFYWNGSSELPMTMTIWTGAAEVGVTVEGSV